MESSKGDQARRSTKEVFEDHLNLRLKGDLETDLSRNYDRDVVLLTANSNRVGLDGNPNIGPKAEKTVTRCALQDCAHSSERAVCSIDMGGSLTKIRCCGRCGQFRYREWKDRSAHDPLWAHAHPKILARRGDLGWPPMRHRPFSGRGWGGIVILAARPRFDIGRSTR